MRNLKRAIVQSWNKVADNFRELYKRQSEYLTRTKSQRQPPKTVKWTRYEHAELNNYFIRFFNSKPVEGRVSGKSLAFVVGAEYIGKTEFIESNIAEIKKRKKYLQFEFHSQKIPYFGSLQSPQSFQTQIQQTLFDNSYYAIIKKNYKNQGGQLNFINFVEDLHDQIIMNINELMIKFQSNQTKKKSVLLNAKSSLDGSNTVESPSLGLQKFSLLTPKIIKDIVTSQYAPEYIFIHIKDVVFAIVQDKDKIFLDSEQRAALQHWNDKNLSSGMCTSDQFYQKLYLPLIDLLWKAQRQKFCNLKTNQQIQKTQIAIELFYSVFKRIQYENRPEQYAKSWYQTGIQTTSFLFDLLNFLSGTGMYIRMLEKSYIHAETNQQRQEIKLTLQNSNNFILQGNHIDIMLCLINIDQLLCFKNKSKSFLDFFDHVVCRTVEQTNFRKHFPIMIQIPNRAFLDDIFQLGKIQGSNPVIIQIPGYIEHSLRLSNLAYVFQHEKVVRMFPIFGRNPHTWKNMIQNMAKGFTMNEIEDGKAPYQQKQRLSAQAKMNRVYTSERCLQLLSNRTLDFQIIQILNIFSKAKGLGMTLTNFVGMVVFQKPFFTSMLQQNVFYHMYYLPYIDYAVNLPVCLNFYRDCYLKKLHKNNSWLRYRLWRSRKQFDVMVLDVRYTSSKQTIMMENQIFGKDYVDLELWTTYYTSNKNYKWEYYEKISGVTIDQG